MQELTETLLRQGLRAILERADRHGAGSGDDAAKFPRPLCQGRLGLTDDPGGTSEPIGVSNP